MLLDAFAHPGMSLDLGGPWTVDGEGRVFRIHDGVGFDVVAVANVGGDKPGDAPRERHHGGRDDRPERRRGRRGMATGIPLRAGPIRR